MKLTSDPYVLARASLQASLLVSTGEFLRNEWPDLRQEFALDLVRRARHFDPARGDRRGFIRGVMRNHATVLVNRKRRRGDQETFPSDSDEDLGRSNSRLLSVTPTTQIDYSIDVRHAVKRLSKRGRELVDLLPQSSVPEICQKMGVSKSQVYRTLHEVRRVFVRSGLGPMRKARRSGLV
jgi:RNA polymerase sigma factor (sigma-70 family)